MGKSNLMIHYVALEEQWQDEKDDLMPIIEDVLSKSKYVHGIEIDEFEIIFVDIVFLKRGGPFTTIDHSSSSDILIISFNIVYYIIQFYIHRQPAQR